MADFEAKFGVNIDTSAAMVAIKQLQSQISAFHRQLAKGSAVNANQQQNLQRQLLSDINSSGNFNASMQRVHSTTENFTNALEKNKLSMGQYFRYAGGASKTFGRNFVSEFATIEKVARERVKTLQTQYIAMGRDANGALQSIAVRPLKLDLDSLATKTAIVAQKQQIFNQLLKQGSTNLLNFGKNTQWAGRQLMVGFTIPLSIFGTMAGKTFMEVEQQAIRFRRVYGELFTTPEEADEMLSSLKELASEFTKYGVSLEKTLDLASDVAAMGKTGNDLLAQVSEATRLSVLGEVDQKKALEATISITNAFGIAAEDLAKKMDFLNAVENQTVTAIEDLTIAIPKAGPVIQQLGGSVEDLAYFLTAMKEGGINASEGANALKSGLARIINPTEKASDMLKGLGININSIVESNAGDIKTTVTEIAFALDALDPLARSRAIEELFGKFQFARISTLFQNITKEGSQAARVLDLTQASTKDLADLSKKELGEVANSTTFQFKKAFEDLRIAIAPIGEQFLKAVTPVIEFAVKILKSFDNMSDGAKNFVVILTAVLGAVAPVALMTFGLLANGVANIIKGFAAVRGIFLKTAQDTTILGNQTGYMTNEQLIASSASASLEQAHMRLTQQFTSEAAAVGILTAAYEKAIIAAQRLTSVSAMPTSIGSRAARAYSNGGIISGEGTGTSDSILAKVSNGEAIIPAAVVKKNPGFFQSLISGKIPGFAQGGMISVGGEKSYAVPDGRSSKAMQAMIDGLLAAGKSVEEIIVVLDRLEEQSSLTAKALREEYKTSSASKDVNRAHLTAPRDGDDGFSYLSGLTRETTQSQNTKLRSGQDKDEFLQEWQSTKGGLNAAGQAGMRQNGDLAANAPLSKEHIIALQQLDDEIGKLAHELAVDGLVSDKELAQAAEIVINKSKNASGAKGQAARGLEERRITETARRTNTPTAKINEGIASGDVILKAGSVTLQDSSGKTVGRVGNQDRDAAMAAGTEAEKRAILQAAKKKSSTEGIAGTRSYTGYNKMSTSTNSQSANIQKQGENDAKAYKKGTEKVKPSDAYERNRNRKSPHSKAAPDGRDDAKAYSDSFNQSVKKTGPRRAQSANIDSQSTIPSTRKVGPRRASSSGAQPGGDAARAAAAERDALKAKEQSVITQQAATASTKRLSSSITGAMYGLTTLAGMAAMSGGEIGKVGTLLFQVTAGFTALMTVTEALTKQNLVELIQDRLSVASKAAEIYGRAANVAGMGAFQVALIRAKAGLMAFVGFGAGLGILAAVAAVAGLVAGVIYYTKLQEAARKKVEALGVGAEFARGKMVEFANQLNGTDLQAPKTGSSSEKATPQSILDAQAKFAENESIMDAFKEQTDKLALLGEDSIGIVVNQMASTLASQGFEAVDIEGLIRALLAKAGKASYQFTLKDVTLGSSNKDLRSTAKNFAGQLQAALDDQMSMEKSVVISGTRVSMAGDDLSAQANAAKVLNLLEEEKAILLGNTAVGLLAVNTALENNAIGATSAATQGKLFMKVFDGLDDALIAEMLPDLAEELGLDNPDLYKGLEDVDYALQALTAQALGMNVPGSLIKLLALNPDDAEEVRAKAIAQKQFNKEYNKYLEAKEAERKSEEDAAINAAAKAELDDLIAAAEEAEKKKVAYEELIKAGKSAAEAAEIVGDSMLYEAYTSAMAADANNKNTDALDAFSAALDRLNSAKLPELSSGQGSNPYQDAMDSLKQQQSDIKNTAVAYRRLRNAGMDIATSANIASDSTTAFALATTKVGTKKYEELLDLIQKIDKASRDNAIHELVRGRSQDIQLQSQFLKVVPLIHAMGVELEDVMSILDDSTIAQAFISDLKDGKLDSKDLLNYLKQIKLLKNIDIKVNLVTDNQKMSSLESAFGDVDAWFQAQEAKIEGRYRSQIESQQSIIDKAQESIEDYNDKIYENEFQLEGIEVKEDAINKKYETRISALDQILQVNKLIQSQEKGSLSVADALSRGDIAEAARAVQASRAEMAASTAEDVKSRIEKSKEVELAAIRSSDGRSRVQIEADVEDYKRKISQIEHDTVKPAEAIRDAAIATRDAEKDALTYLGMNQTAWGDVKTATTAARVEAEAYKTAIEDAMKLYAEMTGKKLPAGYSGGNGSGPSPAAQARIDELNRLRKISRENYQNSTDEAYKQRLYDMNVARGKEIKSLKGVPLASGGMVKYLAAGGFARGTDTVPAMLTPGEFVVKRQAVRNYGTDMLKAVNGGTYSGESVYNYSLSVNVQSEANPNEIANVVMSKIRQVESKRVRGGRF